jgi:AmiR/NasT family two-component response regulator
MEELTESTVRVLVANRPRLLRELVLSTLSEQAGITVVGETENEQDVPSLVAETRPDFLLIALDESRQRPALCDLLLQKFPALRIIAVAPNTNIGICYWATSEIHSATMEASEASLLEVMRKDAVRPEGRIG